MPLTNATFSAQTNSRSVCTNAWNGQFARWIGPGLVSRLISQRRQSFASSAHRCSGAGPRAACDATAQAADPRRGRPRESTAAIPRTANWLAPQRPGCARPARIRAAGVEPAPRRRHADIASAAARCLGHPRRRRVRSRRSSRPASCNLSRWNAARSRLIAHVVAMSSRVTGPGAAATAAKIARRRGSESTSR